MSSNTLLNAASNPSVPIATDTCPCRSTVARVEFDWSRYTVVRVSPKKHSTPLSPLLGLGWLRATSGKEPVNTPLCVSVSVNVTASFSPLVVLTVTMT